VKLRCFYIRLTTVYLVQRSFENKNKN